MSAFIDVCRFFPTLGGTTDWTFSSAVVGYQGPTAAGAVNGTVYSYRAESADLTQWEMGVGAYTSGTLTFARTTVLFNSLGTTAKVNFSTVPQVAVVALAEDLPGLTLNNTFTSTTNATSSITGAMVISGGLGVGKELYIGDNHFLVVGSASSPAAGTLNFITLNSPTSGTNGGAFIQQDIGGAFSWGLGNTSGINGGAYSATTLLKSVNGLNFNVTGGSIVSINAALGYGTGAGGTVTQLTSKTTAVTLNTATGLITMNNAALAAGATAAFTLSNTVVGATDMVYVQQDNGGTQGAYEIFATVGNAQFPAIFVKNTTAGSLSEAVAIRFAVLKSVNS